jgi:single-strand selective monofunctional uracil DNA glycosylase
MTPPSKSGVHPLVAIGRKLRTQVDRLTFSEPVTHVYNPLDYAREPHEAYLEQYGTGKKRLIFLGMNPGPFGMAQTGVPFGDIKMVRDFLGIDGKVGKPKNEHPKRVVQGFDCPRSEVSGTRLWGWLNERFRTAKAFSKVGFVVNYCPLVFMEESSKNRTPDQLPGSEQAALFAICDEALRATVEVLSPEWVIGVGGFAEKRAKIALAKLDVKVATLLHPSPASPRANKGWGREADADLAKAGISLESHR